MFCCSSSRTYKLIAKSYTNLDLLLLLLHILLLALMLLLLNLHVLHLLVVVLRGSHRVPV